MQVLVASRLGQLESQCVRVVGKVRLAERHAVPGDRRAARLTPEALVREEGQSLPVLQEPWRRRSKSAAAVVRSESYQMVSLSWQYKLLLPRWVRRTSSLISTTPAL